MSSFELEGLFSDLEPQGVCQVLDASRPVRIFKVSVVVVVSKEVLVVLLKFHQDVGDDPILLSLALLILNYLLFLCDRHPDSKLLQFAHQMSPVVLSRHNSRLILQIAKDRVEVEWLPTLLQDGLPDNMQDLANRVPIF